MYICVLLTQCSFNTAENLDPTVTPAQSVTSDENVYNKIKSDPPLVEHFPLDTTDMVEIGVVDLQCGNYHFSQQVMHLQV